MLVVLMLKDKLLKLELPNKIIGNYTIADNDIFVNIESNNNSWIMKSNKNTKILKNQKEMYNEVELSKYSFYPLLFSKSGDRGFIYCTDVYDETITQFMINGGE